MKEEKFVWVVGQEGRYQIGDHGTLLSFIKQKGRYGTGSGVRRFGKVMAPLKSDIYIRYKMYNEDHSKDNESFEQELAHRLVYKHFVEYNIPDFNENGECMDVSHKDGNSTNNYYKNLILETHEENCHRIPKFKQHKPVACYNDKGELVKEYNSIKDADVDGYHNSGMRKAMREDRKYKKMWWRFTEEKEA